MFVDADFEIVSVSNGDAAVRKFDELRPALVLADIYMQSLDWRQALHAFEQICALNPDDEKARYNLVDINYRLGQESKALSELDNYLSYLNNQGQKEKIVSFLELLVNDAPGRVSIRRRLADIYRQMGRIPDAVAELDTIGDQLLQSGDTAGAVRTIEAILALSPKIPVNIQLR
jgi:tetratricopeptide (TPR) repeat protein